MFSSPTRAQCAERPTCIGQSATQITTRYREPSAPLDADRCAANPPPNGVGERRFTLHRTRVGPGNRALSPVAAERKWTMALFSDALDALSSLQQSLETSRSSNWLASGSSGGGAY